MADNRQIGDIYVDGRGGVVNYNQASPFRVSESRNSATGWVDKTVFESVFASLIRVIKR